MNNLSIIRNLDSQVQSHAEEFNRFVISVQNDPAHGFAHSHTAMRSAAFMKVANPIIYQLELAFIDGEDALNKSVLLEMIECLDNDVLCGASDLQQSTNPTSNMMAQYELQAKAQLLRWFRKL